MAAHILLRLVLVSSLGFCAAASAQGTGAVFSGTVTDSSGAVLPGVTVQITLPDRGTTDRVVTDGSGHYRWHDLPTGTYVVSFTLDGFTAGPPVQVRVDASAPVRLDRVLELAALEETVTVTASKPPEPAAVIVPQPTPVPDIVPVTVTAFSVCGPRQSDEAREPVAAIAGDHDEPGRRLLGDRDILILDAGTSAGIKAGQNYVVRRRYVADRSRRRKDIGLMGDHTAGLIQVVRVEETSALARTVYICDEIGVGDRVEPYEPVTVTPPAAEAARTLAEPARVLFADEGRTIGAPADLMVIDRGYTDGARPGQRLVVRRAAAGGTDLLVGEAIVVAVQATSATIRIETARDAIMVGDMASLRR